MRMQTKTYEATGWRAALLVLLFASVTFVPWFVGVCWIVSAALS